MRISTSKSEAMVLSRKPMDCPLQVGNESLPQVKEFKYLGVLFSSEGTMEREMGQRILGCHLGTSLGRCSWHVQLGRDQGVDLGPGGGIISLRYPGSALGPPSQSSQRAPNKKVWGSLLELLPPRPDHG
ncbi:hypothetical protein CgunFtcFv8_026256 [Champsocephalus gunnari]|uniref:Uncharacterized protein n=1 Tax=Champsocephalus gunnari TaxID=52237 RepID=A0AAN8CH68_CHAGU|nr:hypothetical protein CgunFtcFv8_026256 [Champsocephalus gunnari]